MGLNLIYDAGQTPLDENESDGLLLNTITTQRELNEAEQSNIEDAIEWTLRKKFSMAEVLSERFCNQLHRRMYGDVWRWAGTFRKTNKNIGVDKYQIPVSLHNLINDCKFWIENQSFSPDEIAIRFKHRIVSIHAYANGNGRHSRLMADVIASHLFGRSVFTWGTIGKSHPDETRDAYLKSLRLADRQDLSRLLIFARS